MARSRSSFTGYDTSLDVSLVSSGPPGSGSKWLIQITTHGFPGAKIITLIKADDQQTVALDTIMEEFVNSSSTEEKLESQTSLNLLLKGLDRTSTKTHNPRLKLTGDGL